MQKKFLKSILIVFMVVLFVLCVTVRATNDTNAESDVVIGGEEEQTNDEEDVGNDEADNENEDELDENEVSNEVSEDENIDSEDTEENTVENETSKESTYVPPETSVPTSSYSTVASIPEANLTLNNILNVILIAVGVIIILLAIAILIRLK